MWRTNLKIVLTVLGTLGVYTAVANLIPQVESEVPEAREVGADVSPEELVSIGEELFHGAGGCTSCHGLGTRAPDLLGEIGARCGERVAGQGCKEYLHESLVEPGAYVVEGFQPIMPDVSRTLSDSQVWALVAFLQSQGGEVTVTSEDLSGTGGRAAAAGPATGGAATSESGGGDGETTSTDPAAIWRSFGCITCHRMDGEGGPVGPPVEEMREGGRSPDYIRRSILSPNADTASGYAPMAGTMPMNFGDRLTAAQLEALVGFLSGGR